MTSRFIAAVVAAFTMFCVSAAPVSAAEHTVEMLNDGGDGQYMIFKPEVLKVEVGDTVVFKHVDPGHNAQTMPEIWPEGAKDFKGEIGEDVSYTVEAPGVYGVKCLPHYMMGMVMLIVAGDAENADQVDGFQPPEMAKERWEKIKDEFADAK